MSSSNASDRADKADEQGIASSSEIAASTLQNRRAFNDTPRSDTPRASTTVVSSQTAPENDEKGSIEGLLGLGEIAVQNMSMRILPNHTAESLGGLYFLSSEIERLRKKISEVGEDYPRSSKLWLQLVSRVETYHSLSRAFNDTLSRPKPDSRDTLKLHKLVGENISPSFKGEDGTWLKSQALSDHSHLTGAMLPFEVYTHGLVQNKWKIFAFASEKSDTSIPKYKSWLNTVLHYLGHVVIIPLLLASMVIPIAAKKLWGPTPSEQVIMHIALVIAVYVMTSGVARSLDSRMLLTMTVASISAEILSG